MPLYLLFRKYRLINFWSLSMGGAVVALLPLLLLLLFSSASFREMAQSLNVFALLALCGFLVGTAYWAVMRFWIKKAL
jgi:hypothetical protein